MPRYVVLRHEPAAGGGKPLHWDFMLETGNVLRTWSVGCPLEQNAVIDAQQLDDHRLAYLDYEGEISGGRGRVSRWDCGTFEIAEEPDGTLRVRLRGDRLDGVVILSPAPGDDQRWTLVFSPSIGDR